MSAPRARPSSFLATSRCRSSVDYEYLIATSENVIYTATCMLLLHRLGAQRS
ncbi:hypothetical protein [Streptosporangium sp. NPDC051022]|uniref:hypothetical protein n=1 Tax=Streptosporangium sp. NPDC051022 TaxID=3155752 RepID=UPI0034306F8F